SDGNTFSRPPYVYEGTGPIYIVSDEYAPVNIFEGQQTVVTEETYVGGVPGDVVFVPTEPSIVTIGDLTEGVEEEIYLDASGVPPAPEYLVSAPGVVEGLMMSLDGNPVMASQPDSQLPPSSFYF
ncbi:unnamed protein product, partial [Rotaria sp. Silwood1]